MTVSATQKNKPTVRTQTPLRIITFLVIIALTVSQDWLRQHLKKKTVQVEFSPEGIRKKKAMFQWNEMRTAFDSVAKSDTILLAVFQLHQTMANRMSLTDRYGSQYISVCIGMKKSMSLHSHASSISASKPSYRDGKPSTAYPKGIAHIPDIEGLPWCPERPL